jgi:hypothetical protein
MRPRYKDNLVLTLYPFSRGFAFVLFEAPKSPVDWGVKEIKEKHRNDKTLAAIKVLVERYRPVVMVIEETGEHRYRRTSRIRKLYRMLTKYTTSERIDLHRIEQHAIWEHFAGSGALTKYEVAKAIVHQVPGFAHRMPRIRKPWMSADPRQSLFDAAALGILFYKLRGVPTPYDGAD